MDSLICPKPKQIEAFVSEKLRPTAVGELSLVTGEKTHTEKSMGTENSHWTTSGIITGTQILTNVVSI